MNNDQSRASIIKLAKTVSATVTACVTILVVLQPWRSEEPAERSVQPQTTASLVAAEDQPAPQQTAVRPETRQPEKPQPARPAVPVREISAQPVETVQAETMQTAALAETAPATDGRSETGKSGTREAADEAEVTTGPESGGEIRLAARSDTGMAVPVPQAEEEGLIPLPVKKERPKPPKLPTPAASIDMPDPKGRLSKVDGDAALAPLMSYDVPQADIEALKDFVKLAYRQKFSDARPLMEGLKDPVAIKFARWYYYRKKAPDTTAEEIQAFLDDNPRWPDRDELREAAEDALFWREDDPKKVIAYFKSRQPQSGAGLAALGGALIEDGKKEDGTKLIRQAWRKFPLTSAMEKKLRKLKVLNAKDHRARADYLLMQDNRRYLSAARRLLPSIEKKWRPSVKARIATVQRARNAGTLLTKLDKTIKRDPGVLFARIQWLRRADKDKKVWSLLRSAPTSAEKLIDPGEWWTEREMQVRLALNKGKPKTAYALAKGHGEGLEHWDLSDAEFLAGWIALRFLDKPKAAREHFLTAAAAGGLPKRRARAGYWLGRTELILNDKTAATARFAEAAQHSHTFYGQLAHQMIASSDAKVSFRTFVRPTQREIDAFASQDVMKAIVIAHKADFENLMSLFLYDRAREIESAPEMILLNELAIRVAPPHRAVRMAKVAMNRDFAVEHYAYPDALPQFEPLADGEAIENALLSALTRQESEFNTSIVSSAGAVGLMQLLPSTAKMVARWHGKPYSKHKLASDPGYNVSLGTAFLHRLISNYDGSYMMALAGYNAGPGRVRQWVKLFGDPREKDVDPIDWIERIPFTETRGYVHKILESAQVYRSRLLGEQAPLRLAEDLHRGRKDKPKFMIGSAAN